MSKQTAPHVTSFVEADVTNMVQWREKNKKKFQEKYGENITFTNKLLSEKGIKINSMLLIQKPYMERRTYATFKAQWPDVSTQIAVASPQIGYEDYFNQSNPKEMIINIMVGDLQRIKEYPKLGYQIKQDIPDYVWAAYEALVSMGYTQHLIK